MKQQETLQPVDLSKSLRILNHGPTVLVSSRHQGIDNVMAAAWSSVVDFTPPKVMVIIASETKTRELVDGSGMFAIQIPTVEMAELTYKVGSMSLANDANKLEKCGIKLFEMPGFDIPLVDGCSAWLVCKVIPEPSNHQKYDLFIGEIVGAWADTHVFKAGRWQFENADPKWRSIHHVAGGHFYAIGEALGPKSGK
jgi:flavin reductase (DIM6/NTAB) family NADH-FMN oxidoreductase RutF